MTAHARDHMNQPHNRRSPLTRHGLTLVEMLAVVIILGLLAAALTTTFSGQVGRAKVEIAKSGIGTVVAAIETYSLETGKVPTMEQGLRVLTERPQGRTESFIKPDQLKDPWGNEYAYITPGAKSRYEVICYGADGRPGGEAGSENADLSSEHLGARGTE